MAYKGDTSAKRWARLQFWAFTLHYLQERGVPEEERRFLCLASEEAGDVAVLLGLGVDPRMIHAVDLRLEAVEAAKARFPSVNVHQGDVAAVAQAIRARHGLFAAAMLDFCANPSFKLMDVIARVGMFVRDEGIIAWLYMRGRERGRMMERIKTKAAHQEMQRRARPDYFAECGDSARRCVTQEEVLERSVPRGWMMMPIYGFDYPSPVENGPPTWMQCQVFECVNVGRPKKGKANVRPSLVCREGAKRFYDYERRAEHRKMMRAVGISASLDDLEATPIAIYEENEERDRAAAMQFDWLSRARGDGPSTLMNFDSSQVAAWKAVEKRRAKAELAKRPDMVVLGDDGDVQNFDELFDVIATFRRSGFFRNGMNRMEVSSTVLERLRFDKRWADMVRNVGLNQECVPETVCLVPMCDSRLGHDEPIMFVSIEKRLEGGKVLSSGPSFHIELKPGESICPPST